MNNYHIHPVKNANIEMLLLTVMIIHVLNKKYKILVKRKQINKTVNKILLKKYVLHGNINQIQIKLI